MQLSTQYDPARWKRNVALFLGGQTITLFGSMLVSFAILWHVTLSAQSGTIMMILTLAITIPMFIISPFAGVWADRYNKKLIINLADAAISFVTLPMAVLFSLGYEYISLLIVCSIARGFGQGIQTPAVNSLLPEIVPAEHLVRVNGFAASMQSAIMFLSPIAGGALIAYFPIQTVLYIDAVTAAIGISILFFLVKTPPRPAQGAYAKGRSPEEKKSAWRDMAEGFAYLKTHAFLKKILIAGALFNLFAAPASFLTPLQTIRNFGSEEWRLVAIEIAFSIGMAAGGALIGAWGGFKNKSYTLALSTALFGLACGALGLGISFAPYLAFMGLAGIAISVFNAPMMALLQTKIEAEYMGRVFSVFNMLASLVMPSGMLIWGPLADTLSIDLLLLVSSAGIVCTGLFFISSKTLRHAGAP